MSVFDKKKLCDNGCLFSVERAKVDGYLIHHKQHDHVGLPA